MSFENPYESPKEALLTQVESHGFERIYGKPSVTAGSVGIRHFAAIVDNVIAMIVSVLFAKMLSDEWPGLQTTAMVVVYLAYYFLSEWLLGRTPVKLAAGLIVIRRDGTRPGLREVLIRTGMRLIEVNPLLLGALPAALSIVFSKQHQRFGDKWADTLVVRADVLQALKQANPG